MDEFTSLIDVLEAQVRKIPDQTAYYFQSQPVTYAALWDEIIRSAAYLSKHGVQPGQTVLIALPNQVSFFAAFFACQWLGAIPVPISPASGGQRIQNIGSRAQANHLICMSDHQLDLIVLEAQLTIHLVDQIDQNVALHQPARAFHEIAFIQFTSGTTGAPKGAVITQAHLLINIRQMIAGMEITASDVFVSWLPVYHDMGLILMGLTPLVLGIPSHILPASLGEITNWLKTITEVRGTFTAAPDFAYRMLFRYIREPKDYDLSSLRVALNAAEPVRVETIQKFHQYFSLENVMVAGYGLAEATVGVSMWKPGTTNKVSPDGFVSVGQPFPQIEIKIIADELPVAPNMQGEIVIKSPANIPGYYLQPEAADQLFWQASYIRSGDIGFVDEAGYLYILDRQKNVIKHLGRTIAPKEIEEAVEGLPELRQVSALGIDEQTMSGEQIVLFAELRRQNQPTELYEMLVIEIVQRIHAHIGIRPARVVLLAPKSIPKTANGKIRYLELKRLYQAGELQDSILFSS